MMTRRNLMIGAAATAALGGAGWALWPRTDEYAAAMAELRRPLQSGAAPGDLIRYATLAANSHNTQPWMFRLGDERISILPDPRRATPVVDPDDHHLFISLGCAAENLSLAARSQGLEGAGVIAGAPQAPHIDVSLTPGAGAETPPMFAAIPHRQSTRTPFDGQPVPPGLLKQLVAAAQVPGVEIQLVTDELLRQRVMEHVLAANSVQVNDRAFVRELQHWIRFNPRAALEQGDGLYSACTGNPSLPSWMGQMMFRMAFGEKSENAKFRKQMETTAGYAIFTGDRADPAHWIAVGRAFQRFALEATAQGIRTAHLNQPLEVAAMRADFAADMGLAGVRPDLLVRFGYAAPMPMSPRRPVSAVLAPA